MAHSSINEIAFTYTNKQNKTVKGIMIMPAGRFEAYQWFSQESLRFLAMYSAYGPDGTQAIIEGFSLGLEYQASGVFGYCEYKGHKLIELKAKDDDKKPVRFGVGKAKALSAIFATYGIKAFAALCQEVAGDATVSEYNPKSKGKGGKGGGGKSKSAESESVESLDGLSEGLKRQLLGMLPKEDGTVESIVAQLRTLQTEAEAYTLLSTKCPQKDALLAVAKAVALPNKSGEGVGSLMDRIVSQTVGNKLARAAIRGERADQSVKKAPATVPMTPAVAAQSQTPAPQGPTVDELLQQEQSLLMQLMMVRSRINALATVNA